MSHTPRTEPSEQENRQWLSRRHAIGVAVTALTAAGECYQCRDLETGGTVLGDQDVIVERDDARVVLSFDPRAPGHTIVVWKRHAHDFTELDDTETAALALLCRDVARAIRLSLSGVERVYQVTMCDGPINHLHCQLIPRYVGAEIGSKRLVDPRGPLLDGPAVARAIRDAYLATSRR